MYSTTLHTEEGNLSRKQAFDCDHGDTQEEITRRKHNSSKAIYLQFSSHYSLKTNIKELEINSPESKTYHSLTMQHVTTASNVIFPYIFTFGTPFRTQFAVGWWQLYLSGARCRLAYGPADATTTHCLLLQ